MATTTEFSRREFLTRSIAAAAWTGGLLASRTRAQDGTAVREFTLRAEASDVAVGPGRVWRTWTYNGRTPGPEIRVREGDLVRVTVINRLPQPTSVHWHGVPVPNAMDGVAGLTQVPIAPGDAFTYEFTASSPGTYFYHSHAGLQLDRGLYGPLVIEPAEPPRSSAYDREYVLMLDDWLDGTPEDAYAQLRRGGGMGGGMMGGGDPLYAGYLLNGATSGAAAPFRVTRGERVRLRIINAASATTFRFAVGGHRLRVTHADGQEVRPVEVDSIVVGMGERYDLVLEAGNPGAWPLLAGPVDIVVPGVVVPVIYEGTFDRLVPPVVWPSALLRGRTLRYADLAPAADESPTLRPPRVIRLTLGSTMMRGYVWTINGQAYPNADPIPVTAGESLRLAIFNATGMRHPMHLHGHFFRLRTGAASATSGPVKDTVVVAPMMGSVELDFETNNPGRWFFHCHHLYHMEAGMARVLEYR